MSVTVLRLATALYAAGAGAYILFFARPRHTRAAVAGYALVLSAFVVHAASIGLACREFGGGEFFNLRGGFGMVGWIVAGAFLLLQRFSRLPAVGAFVLPLVLMAVLPGLFGVGPHSRGAVPEVVRQPALGVHAVTAAAGVALFGIASVVAIMYLLQEREVKGKRFGSLFPRLPSLETLDRLTQRLVRLGFVVLTVALVAGSIVAKKTWGSFWDWDAQQVVWLLIWGLYGVVVQLRHLGLHGHRYALLTVVGFAIVISSIVGLREAPGATKHRGDFQGEVQVGSKP